MKGVIVAAGYGSRFLPVTKTIPKEMLPLLDRPAIDFVVQEFIDSGIHEILIITSRRKKALEDFYDRDVELESLFSRDNAEDKLNKIQLPEADIFFVRQTEMRGTGHALLSAAAFVGDEAFVAAYPDDLHFGSVPLSRQLMETYDQTGCTVLATVFDPPNLHSYAVLGIDKDNLHVTDMVEKPAPGTELSREVSIGRFLYNPGFLPALTDGWKSFAGRGEYYHVEGIKRQISQKQVVFRRADGTRVDTGTREGYLRALALHLNAYPELKRLLRSELDGAEDPI